MATVKFKCTQCGKHLRIRDVESLTGDTRARKGKCPSCGAGVLILGSHPGETTVELPGHPRWLVTAVLLASLTGGAASANLLPRLYDPTRPAEPLDASTQVMRAQRFELTSPGGRTVATLAAEENRVLLRLCDPSGAPRAELYAGNHGTGIMLLDGQETMLAQLAAGKNGTLFVLQDSNGNSRLSASVHEETTGLSLHDRTGQSRLGVIYSDFPNGGGGGAISIQDRSGATVWAQP